MSSTLPDIQLDIIGDIYDASLEARLWSPVIERISHLLDAEQANILAFDQLNPHYFLFHSFNTQPEALELYQSGGFAPLDMEFAGKWMLTTAGIGHATANHKHFGGIENYMRAAGRLYDEFFAKVDILYQCGALLEKTDFRWSVIGLHRGHHSEPYADEQIDMLTRLVPHLRRALQIHRQLIIANQEHAQLYRLLDGLTAGVLLLDVRGRIRYANPNAERLLQRHDGLCVGLMHDLKAPALAQQTELQTLINGAIGTSRRDRRATTAGGVMACPDTNGRGLLMLTVAPLSELAGYAELGSDEIAAAIFLTDPQAQHTLSTDILRHNYGLTARECEVCTAFLNSATVQGTAELCGISVSTVRTYLKDIYEKTGQRSQAALMQLLMGLRSNFEHIR